MMVPIKSELLLKFNKVRGIVAGSSAFAAGILLMVILLLQACNSDRDGVDQPQGEDLISSAMERLPDNKAGDIVRQSIEDAGGWNKWTKKKSLSYTKIIAYYDSAGTKEREVRQLHQYLLHPQFKGRISWEDNGDQYYIINNGQQAWKFKNNQEMTDEDSKNQAWNSSFGSNYVMCMPFKLADQGVILTYEGLKTLPDETIAQSVRVEYEKGAGSAGGMHTWWYYFDPKTSELEANFLDYGQGYSYTKYESFREVSGIKVNEKRYSYATNKDQELKYIRTIYENEDIKFDVPLEDKLFEPEEELAEKS